ncbi:uncharacterized protein LOC8281552 isoform X1 [Ricinus communis]|uniref:uncharacterized protein LOC8281552 isoform X1 n=1 Tax=Ricinus communis TaxID=3988 RepID=UPI00201AE44C|nr:uncharacterized protein LOC8281552 isoform X1 [Ricinus communis]
MQGSVFAGNKSGSNWLDRLRSTKGFPATENLDLDNFLSDPSLPNSESTQSLNRRVTSDQTEIPDTLRENGEREWFGVVTNVLCDLFNMGDSQDKNSRISGKKSSRKQTNPKFFDADSVRKEEYVQAATTASFHSDNNSNVVGMNADCFVDDDDEYNGKLDEKKEKSSSDKELRGYSKSEVTVIDTSFEVWKFDKLVFRRKSIWKVRDKKGKSWNFASKKRKGNHLESATNNGNVGCKKKAKMSDSEFASSKESNGGDFALPSNGDHKQLDENRDLICRDTFDDHLQVSRKRSSRKSEKNGSSVILMKIVPTSKKCGRNLPKNRHKDAQKQ